jgi:SOS-response transcriptional repressor LexA
MAQSMSDYKAAMINYKIAFEPGPISFNSISDEINVFFDAYQGHKQNPQDIPISEKTIPLYDEYHEGYIPLYSMRVACSALEMNILSDNEEPEIEAWVDVSGHGFTPNKDRYFAVHAKGDSMSPRIKDGDICIFEWYNNGSGGTRDGKIVLVYAKDYNFGDDWEFTIKEYHSEKIQDEDGWQHSRIVLKPLNTKYKAFEVTEEEQPRIIGVFKCVL